MNVLNQKIEKRFAMYHGDCVEVMRGIPDASIHYSIFSPPFASLYTYSNSERDMGNSRDENEFSDHFRFLIRERACSVQKVHFTVKQADFGIGCPNINADSEFSHSFPLRMQDRMDIL